MPAAVAAGATVAGGVAEGGAGNAEPGTLAQGMSAALFPDAPLAVQQALGRLVESGSTVTYRLQPVSLAVPDGWAGVGAQGGRCVVVLARANAAAPAACRGARGGGHARARASERERDGKFHTQAGMIGLGW